MPAGRPSKYSLKLAAEICERMAMGESLNRICQDKEMPARSTVNKWIFGGDHQEFADMYAHAREMLCEFWADEVMDIADDGSNDYMKRENPDGSTLEVYNGDAVQRSRLRVDSRKWILSKLVPRKYGEKVELTGEGGGAIQLGGTVKFVRAEE